MKTIFSVFLCFSLGGSYAEDCAPSKFYSRNGKKVVLKSNCFFGRRTEAEFVNDKKDGFEKLYRTNGTLENISFFKRGVQVDSSIWYDSVGRVIDIGYFKNGLQSDSSKRLDSIGRVLHVTRYYNGHVVGPDSGFFPNDQPASLTTYDSSGQKHGPQKEWEPDGKLKFEYEYQKGEIIYTKYYHPNGKPQFVKEFDKHGDTTHYNEGGDTATLVSHKLLTATRWDSLGRVLAKVVNGAGVWDTTYSDYVRYYENGKEQLRATESRLAKEKAKQLADHKANEKFDSWFWLIKSGDISKHPGLSVNDSLLDRRRPIHLAAGQKSHKAMQQLLDEGAEINILNGNEESPLTISVGVEDLEGVKLLLSRGADVNLHNPKYSSQSRNYTPLAMAVNENDLPMVQLLLEHGAKIDIPWNGDFATPMHTAACKDDEKMLEVLLKVEGANWSVTDADDDTPLDYAKMCKKPKNAALIERKLKQAKSATK